MMRSLGPVSQFLAALVLASAAGCGAQARRPDTSYEAGSSGGAMEPMAQESGYYGYSADYDMTQPESIGSESAYAADEISMAPGGDYGPAPAPAAPAAGTVAADLVPAEMEGLKYAQAQKTAPQPGAGALKPEPSKPETPSAPDRLILYTADMGLAVFRIDEKIEEIRLKIKDWGGYLVSMDSSQIVFRVPADRFEEALEALGKLGDVTYRNVQGTDVTEEFRDLNIRLENSEAMRDRFLELLSQCKNINESLLVEHELERITEQIELIKGRLKYLSEAAMYSKITVYLAVKKKAKKPIPPLYAPFKWIQDIGLDSLFGF